MSELLYQVALTKIPKVGAITAKNLIAYCGSAESVFGATKKELLRIPNIGEVTADNIRHQSVLAWAEQELDFLEKNDIQTIFHTDPRFPQRLQHCHDAPLMLFYKGTTDLNHQRIVSIVGTRKPSAYGKEMCKELVEGLQAQGVLVLSGLAFGVDIIAHRVCVDLDIPTIGILGHGLRQIYPSEHKKIAEQMLENGGLLTEYPSDQIPSREHFPMRNRIVAGMCDALVVVETARKGGSMISAESAFAYNREVFAFSGRATDASFAGCNYLIKSSKAQMIENADDLIAAMAWAEKDVIPKPKQALLFAQLDEKEQIIYDTLSKNSPESMTIDSLLTATLLSHSELVSLLLNMEFKGIIRSLPGSRVVLR